MHKLIYYCLAIDLCLPTPNSNLARDVSPLSKKFRTQSFDVNKLSWPCSEVLEFVIAIFTSEWPLDWSVRLRWNVFRRLQK